MLTPTERTWLLKQRELLREAATKTNLYAQALALYDDKGVTIPWWRLFKARAVRRARQRVQRKHDVWVDQVYSYESLISAWIDIYRITNGADRGPIFTTTDGPGP